MKDVNFSYSFGKTSFLNNGILNGDQHAFSNSALFWHRWGGALKFTELFLTSRKASNVFNNLDLVEISSGDQYSQITVANLEVSFLIVLWR